MIEKEEKQCTIIDIATPGDNRVSAKEEEKIEKYDNFKWEIKKMRHLQKTALLGTARILRRTLEN